MSASHGLLRLLTCGSVDDGKSTLIGRLLYDSQLIADDTLAAITRDSRKHGTVGEEVDLALLVDGLEAERQQGIWGCPVSVDGLSACGLGVGHGGLHVCFVGHWRTISQRRMEPHCIVPAFDVAEACHPGFSL